MPVGLAHEGFRAIIRAKNHVYCMEAPFNIYFILVLKRKQKYIQFPETITDGQRSNRAPLDAEP